MNEGQAGFHNSLHTWQSGVSEGKLERDASAAQPPKQLTCPECGSKRLYRDGLRYTHSNTEPTQRWLCRNCSLRFSQPNSNNPEKSEHYSTLHTKSSYTNPALLFTRQVCVTEAEGSKNLAETAVKSEAEARQPTTTTDAINKGKIVEYSFHMQKQGYASETIRGNQSCLRALLTRNANLLNPESVKEALAKEKNWSQNRRRNVINAYTLFLKINGLQWEKLKCQVTQKFPFIPKEEELDTLVAGCGKKTATFLQLLKETAMRSGEAKRLQWINIDSEKHLITLNEPEKGSNPRIWKVSQKLIGMLDNLPRESTKIFGDGPIKSMRTTFIKARRRLAAKLENPRLLQITFHTFRHWKATMLYHQTKDPYYVKNFLGHKSLRNTEIYINIEHTIFEPSSDEFTVKVATNPEDIKSLLEAGFDYVCERDSLMFLRKRK